MADPTALATNASFAMNALLAVPRFAQRASSAFMHIPSMDELVGNIFSGGSIIADATGSHTVNSTITNTSNSLPLSTAATMAEVLGSAMSSADGDDTASFVQGLLSGVRHFGNMGGLFSYLTSRWALATFTAAIVLNRTQFYASSRQPLALRWYIRLVLYGLTIFMFTTQLMWVLQAMKCQTSPDFPLLRYGDPLKQLAVDFGGESGFLYSLSSKALFWRDDAACCAAMGMSPLNDNKLELLGSLSILWPFFFCLCISQFIETMACALQGRIPQPETGMTIFEHSLAFAECEAMISSALGFGLFGLPKLDSAKPTRASSGETSGIFLTRSMILRRLNMPPEVLLVCLVTCLSQLSSAILAITGLRDKVRLVNTGIWALCYMASFMWSFLKVVLNPLEGNELGILRFPTVCIVGFIPHMLIVVGILVCGLIYGIAILLTALSPPDGVDAGNTMSQRFAWAYQNLQANVQFSSTSSIRISMSEDFYTTLLKIGFNVLTAASEAVYLNEGSAVRVAQTTWLEAKRLDEFTTRKSRSRGPEVPSELLGEGIARGVEIDHYHNNPAVSGYARERRSRVAIDGTDRARFGEIDSGLGLAERRSRMQLTYDFAAGIFWLLAKVFAGLALNVLSKAGIEQRPSWLLKAAGSREGSRRSSVNLPPAKSEPLDFWIINPDGSMSLPANGNVDVEAETRRRLEGFGSYNGEEGLADNLYRWWRSNGWWGDIDTSGDYQPAERDDDTTSMISMSTNDSSVSEDFDSSNRTPTREDPYGIRSRHETPDPEANELDLQQLARLLNPQSSRERDEARLLSHSLQTNRPMTRAQYRRQVDRGRAQILGLRNDRQGIDSPLRAEEEEEALERFLLKRRQAATSRTGVGESWDSGAEGMGAGGPQCVVCQSAPRTILVWPCGCLSACDECRVGLAARNFSKCICCRTDVAAYSRLYVP